MISNLVLVSGAVVARQSGHECQVGRRGNAGRNDGIGRGLGGRSGGRVLEGRRGSARQLGQGSRVDSADAGQAASSTVHRLEEGYDPHVSLGRIIDFEETWQVSENLPGLVDTTQGPAQADRCCAQTRTLSLFLRRNPHD